MYIYIDDTLTSQKFGDMFMDRRVHGFKRFTHFFVFSFFFFFFCCTNNHPESVYRSRPFRAKFLANFIRITFQDNCTTISRNGMKTAFPSFLKRSLDLREIVL